MRRFSTKSLDTAERAGHLRRRTLALVSASFVLLAPACDENSQELRDIERGRDNRPAIDMSPPEEAN